MADVNPQTTFHVAFTEREYHLVTLALALVAGADVKPDGHHRRLAATLNQQLLTIEQRQWQERVVAIERKITKAPPVPDEEEISAG